ncbi:plasmid replication protein RepC [Paracoccus zhejiangensis]|uniref:Replication initiation protein RepC n=1 Tax=Paracoccus zhejiangensis TaxID=1077935 RepID=A0A2H5F679_9RHOB|nr:plasmid replication protein RepC [Paracoccus zhejiangensis]AUH67035.1 replication initiation protein RepC [Paracoccus zhejiangensis]
MRHISMTPFGRQPVTAGLLATQALAEAPALQAEPDKWALLRDLTTARASFAVSDRDLVVLSALLSFHPGKVLADDEKLIVFPSNAALSDRAHGMAESTLRRHLAALTAAGLILRRDSPNGKRYATRDRSGVLDRAFGFDLRPLLVLSPRIAAAAETARRDALALRRLREMVVVRLRDASKLIVWAEETGGRVPDGLLQAVASLQRALRRKLDIGIMAQFAAEADILLDRARALIKTEKMGGSDADNERHQQNSNPDSSESDPCCEQQKATPTQRAEPAIPLALVLKAAPDIRDYATEGIHDWRALVAVANFVRPMLGISADAWTQARQSMGDAVAAVTLACILQRAETIACPGGYLRALTEKAGQGAFSPGPMVMALLRAENERAV